MPLPKCIRYELSRFAFFFAQSRGRHFVDRSAPPRFDWYNWYTLVQLVHAGTAGTRWYNSYSWYTGTTVRIPYTAKSLMNKSARNGTIFALFI
jgi:hypothetical protein